MFDSIKDFAQTVGPICTALFVLAVFGMPYIGVELMKRARVRLDEAPNDAGAQRLLRLGVWMFQRGSHSRELGARAAELLPPVPRALARFAFASIPEAEAPPGSTITVTALPDGGAVVKVEKPKNDNDEPPPPPAPAGPGVASFFAPLRRTALAFAAALACLALFGCKSLDGAKLVVNGAHDTLIATQPLLHEKCTVPALEAVKLPDLEAAREKARIEGMGCGKLATAYADLYSGYLVGHATIVTIEAGACVGVSDSMTGCNLAGALQEIGLATKAVASSAGGVK